MTPYTFMFTTGRSGPTPNAAVKFTKVAQSISNGNQYTDVVVRPRRPALGQHLHRLDPRLPDQLQRQSRHAQKYTSVQAANGGAETITGITFDPASTAANPLIWVDESQYATGTASDFTGKVAAAQRARTSALPGHGGRIAAVDRRPHDQPVDVRPGRRTVRFPGQQHRRRRPRSYLGLPRAKTC